MSVYEAIGIGYTLFATAIFTAQLIYFAVKGLTHVQRLASRGQTEKNSNVEESESIKGEMAKSV